MPTLPWTIFAALGGYCPNAARPWLAVAPRAPIPDAPPLHSALHYTTSSIHFHRPEISPQLNPTDISFLVCRPT
ncbi:hypothetical protein C8R47DRAFT_1228210 [Mycena vitilis]|nr:hypothetical protein C8R47DRAFT_1228210 [Mycena vitilis]